MKFKSLHFNDLGSRIRKFKNYTELMGGISVVVKFTDSRHVQRWTIEVVLYTDLKF